MSDIFYIKQNDTGPSIGFAVTPTTISFVGASATASLRDPDGAMVFSKRVASFEALTGTPTLRYDWQAGDTAKIGLHAMEFEVTYSDGSITTFPNTGNIKVLVVDDIA